MNRVRPVVDRGKRRAGLRRGVCGLRKDGDRSAGNGVAYNILHASVVAKAHGILASVWALDSRLKAASLGSQPEAPLTCS